MVINMKPVVKRIGLAAVLVGIAALLYRKFHKHGGAY